MNNIIPPHIIKSVILLIIIISSNFISETLNCNLQKILSENIYAKHIINLFTLYFIINIVNDNDIEHPLIIIKNTIIIYILFLLFSRINIYFTMIVVGLFIIFYIIMTYREHYNKKQNNHHKNLVNILDNIQQILIFIIISIIIIGFIIYFREKYIEHYNNWSIIKFIFGIPKCKSIK